MKLVKELNENVQLLTEEKNGKKTYMVEGVFMQADKPNKNGRIYPSQVLIPEVERYVKECVLTKRALGELGHSANPSINLERVSHLITDLRVEGSNIIGKARIMDTPYGQIVKNFVDEGVKLGVSSRGLGSLRETSSGLNEVQSDFFLATVDIVADPSAPDAFVNGIMEDKEWVMVKPGKFIEQAIEGYKKQIKQAKKSELDEGLALKLLEDYLSKLSKL